MNINQTNQHIKTISAKQTLGIPLTERETALLTLYGEQPKKDKIAEDSIREEAAQ